MNENSFFKRLFSLIILYFSGQFIFSQSLSVGEVFDFQKGDEMGIYRDEDQGPWEYRFYKVTDRKNIGKDTIKVTFFKGRQHLWGYDWLNDYATETVTYTGLDKPYFEDFQLRDTFYYIYAPDDTLKQGYAGFYIFKDTTYLDSCNRMVNERYEEENNPYRENHSIHIVYAYQGLGVLKLNSLYDPNGNTTWETFTYYIKNGELCGTKEGFPLSAQDAKFLPPIDLYPNPASDFLNINCERACRISIYNTLGEKVAGRIIMDKDTIDIRALQPGLYIVEVIIDHRIIRKKLMVL